MSKANKYCYTTYSGLRLVLLLRTYPGVRANRSYNHEGYIESNRVNFVVQKTIMIYGKVFLYAESTVPLHDGGSSNFSEERRGKKEKKKAEAGDNTYAHK